MKTKFLTVCMAALMLFTTACSGSSTPAVEININDATQTIIDKVEFADGSAGFAEVGEAMVENYYSGISDVAEEYRILINGTGAQTDEIAVIKAKSGKASDVKKLIEERIERQKTAFTDYGPADARPKLDSPVIETSGDYVIFIIAPDSANAKQVAKDILAGK